MIEKVQDDERPDCCDCRLVEAAEKGAVEVHTVLESAVAAAVDRLEERNSDDNFVQTAEQVREVGEARKDCVEADADHPMVVEDSSVQFQ